MTKPRSRAPLAAAVLLALTVLSVKVTGFDMSLLARRIKEFFVILGQMIPPQWSYMPQIWQPLFDTIKMSLLGSVIGSLLVVPFAMLASSNIIHNRDGRQRHAFDPQYHPHPAHARYGAYCHLCVRPGHAGRHHGHCHVSPSPTSARFLYEEIETVDMGAFEAMEAMGSTKVRAFISSIVPQVLPSYLSNCLFCFEGNVRYASILGYVGAGGLGLILNEKIGWREYSSVGMILLALFVHSIHHRKHQPRRAQTAGLRRRRT